MGLVKSPKQCLVCSNPSDTFVLTLLTTEESQKIFNICCSYVKDAINIEFWMNSYTANNNQLTFCKNCLDCSSNLSQLAEQLSKLKKEINDLSCSFSETIAKQRCQAKSNKSNNKQFNKRNGQFRTKNNKSTNLVSSERVSLRELPSDSEGHLGDSFIDLDDSKELKVEETAIDEIGSELVKTENDNIFLDYEDGSCIDNVSGYGEEEYINEINGTKYLATKDENEVDPLEEIKVSTYTTADCNSFSESEAQILTFGSLSSELSSTITTPKHLTKRIRKVAISNRDDTYQDGGRRPSRISKKGKTGVKSKKSKIREKSYKCSICEKCFYTDSALKYHLMTHTGEKPYKCSWCESSFVRLDHMKDHETTHTGKKRHKCSYCKMRFIRADYLKDHLINHTGEMPFKCSMCEMTFKTRAARWRHLKKVHSEIQSLNAEFSMYYFLKYIYERHDLGFLQKTTTNAFPNYYLQFFSLQTEDLHRQLGI